MEIQLCEWNTSLQPVGTRAECLENWCSMRKHRHYLWHQMLSVFNSQWNCLPLHLLFASQLSKKDLRCRRLRGKNCYSCTKIGQEEWSYIPLLTCRLPSFAAPSTFLHGMNATFSAWALSNDEGSFRWVIAASLLVRKMQNPETNSSFLIIFPEFLTYGACIPLKSWPESLAFAHFVTAGSRRAHNPVCTPYLDFGGNLFCLLNQSEAIFARTRYFKRLRRDCMSERSSKPKFCIIEVIMLI